MYKKFHVFKKDKPVKEKCNFFFSETLLKQPFYQIIPLKLSSDKPSYFWRYVSPLPQSETQVQSKKRQKKVTFGEAPTASEKKVKILSILLTERLLGMDMFLPHLFLFITLP